MEFAVVFAVSAFLIRLGICYLLDVWWVLLIIGAVVIGIVIACRIWKSEDKW